MTGFEIGIIVIMIGGFIVPVGIAIIESILEKRRGIG